LCARCPSWGSFIWWGTRFSCFGFMRCFPLFIVFVLLLLPRGYWICLLLPGFLSSALGVGTGCVCLPPLSFSFCWILVDFLMWCGKPGKNPHYLPFGVARGSGLNCIAPGCVIHRLAIFFWAFGFFFRDLSCCSHFGVFSLTGGYTGLSGCLTSVCVGGFFPSSDLLGRDGDLCFLLPPLPFLVVSWVSLHSTVFHLTQEHCSAWSIPIFSAPLCPINFSPLSWPLSLFVAHLSKTFWGGVGSLSLRIAPGLFMFFCPNGCCCHLLAFCCPIPPGTWGSFGVVFRCRDRGFTSSDLAVQIRPTPPPPTTICKNVPKTPAPVPPLFPTSGPLPWDTLYTPPKSLDLNAPPPALCGPHHPTKFPLETAHAPTVPGLWPFPPTDPPSRPIPSHNQIL